MLSCVVDQITSPSLLTRRTAATASCFRSVLRLLRYRLRSCPILGARAARSGAAVAATTSAETKVGLCMRAIARGVVLVNTRYSAEPRRMASACFQHGAHVVLADFKNHGLLAALIVGESTVK